MLDGIQFLFMFSAIIAVLYGVAYLLYKAGMLKQAAVALLTVILLGGVAIASGHAETTRSAIVVSVDDNTLTLLDGAGLFWEWEGVEDFNIFDVVSFQLIDNGTDSILDDAITQPTYSAIRVDKEWIIRFLVDVGEIELAVKLIKELP